ncbi:MAG: hypothetical protein JO197_08810 [Acidobacteria bacterium]|nr:hypothetical protein [Acidobacteriota bacterium]MBV9478086.1 hypothetical protein [Acidobacteriota bacterium]
MRRLSVLLVLALPLHADVVADVRTALTRLTARDPIHATYEVQRAVKNEGKFDNDSFDGRAAVELEGDASGFRVIVPRALVDVMERELQSHAHNPKQPTPTVNAMRDFGPVDTADAIDFAPTLLQLLDGATLASDKTSAWQGKPARAITFRLADRRESDVGKETIAENRLTLWVGTDLIPLGAEHVRSSKFSFLIFHGEATTRRLWTLARLGDRLVRVRRESSESGSGMGQKSNEQSVAVVRVH